MDITLPKWMANELHKDTTLSLQTYIKLIIREYINNEDYREEVRNKIREEGERRRRV